MKLFFTLCYLLPALVCASEYQQQQDNRPQSFSVVGNDDRVEVYQLQDEKLKKFTHSIAAMVFSDSGNKIRIENDSYSIQAKAFKYSLNGEKLDAQEKFYGQPSLSQCSAFVVAPDLVLTAAHCLSGQQCSSIYFVFDYQINGKNDYAMTSELQSFSFAKENVFKCSSILNTTSVKNLSNLPNAQVTDRRYQDWALVQLDRFIDIEKRPLLKLNQEKPLDHYVQETIDFLVMQEEQNLLEKNLNEKQLDLELYFFKDIELPELLKESHIPEAKVIFMGHTHGLPLKIDTKAELLKTRRQFLGNYIPPQNQDHFNSHYDSKDKVDQIPVLPSEEANEENSKEIIVNHSPLYLFYKGDAGKGHSGGVIFNSNYEVEGVLVRGMAQQFENGRSFSCQENAILEACDIWGTRASVIAPQITQELKDSNDRYHLRSHDVSPKKEDLSEQEEEF